MRVKICGITNLEDAINAVEAGADAIGFVFYKNSSRYIDPFEARNIIDKLPPFIQTVGLFVNENEDFINQVCINAKIHLAQIIDDVHYTDFEALKIKYIRVLRVKNEVDLKSLGNEYTLVDSFVDSFGGEGQKISTQWFKSVDCSKVILAGGLNKDNLKQLKSFNFYGVDVSSGVEQSKGKKDKQKMIDFINEARELN